MASTFAYFQGTLPESIFSPVFFFVQLMSIGVGGFRVLPAVECCCVCGVSAR